MTGLILKDLFGLKKQGKILAFLAVFYIVYSISLKSISMLGGMGLLMCAMMPITTMSYDEYCKWDRYALSMPISRKTIVLSKYILSIILELVGLIVLVPISIIMVKNTGEMKMYEAMLMLIAISGVGITFLSFLFPIIFKFGVEKGRMLMLFIIFSPTILILLLPKLNIKVPSEQTLKHLIYVSPFLVIAILLISIQISINIYEKKEF